MNKIEKMKLVGVTLPSPSFAKNSKKSSTYKCPSQNFVKKGGSKGGIA